MVIGFYFLYKFAAKLTEINFFLTELPCSSLSRAMLSDSLVIVSHMHFTMYKGTSDLRFFSVCVCVLFGKGFTTRAVLTHQMKWFALLLQSIRG